MKKMENAVEIENLGSVYNGPWEKKYWSSSRGKHRYPFPVGYRAWRKEGERTFLMKVESGDKGPLFIVSCGDTECSGPTPTAAWEAIMKAQDVGNKKSSKARLVNGKEMFGFADPLVQYLLRELQTETEGSKRDPLVEINSNCYGNSRTPSVVHQRKRKRVLSEKLTWPTEKKRFRTSRKKRNAEDGEATTSDTRTRPQDPDSVKEYVPDSESEFEEPIDERKQKAGHLSELEPVFPITDGKPKERESVPNDLMEPESSEKPDAAIQTKLNDVENSREDTIFSPVDSAAKVELDDSSQLVLSSEENTIESESLGQEVTRYMMSLLLPSAVPLLKNPSRKKVERHDPTEKIVTVELDVEGKDTVDNGVVLKNEETPTCEDIKMQSADAVIEEASAEQRIPKTTEEEESGYEISFRKITSLEQNVEEQHVQQDYSNRLGSSRDEQFTTEVGQELENVDTTDDCKDGNQLSAEVELLITEREVECGTVKQASGKLDDENSEVDHPHEDNIFKDKGNVETTGKFRPFRPINTELTMLDTLVPVVAIEHVLPVHFVMLNVRSEQVLVYCVRVKEKFQSDVRIAQTFHMEPCDEFAKKLRIENGIRFTFDGENLLVLGCFGDENTDLQKNVLRVIPLLPRKSETKLEAKLELLTTVTMRCLLVTSTTEFLSGGDGGHVKQWEMHPSWSRDCNNTSLPVATYNGVPFHTITRMVLVPNADHLVIGSDGGDGLAIWDTKKKQLLYSYRHSQYVFNNFHAIDVSLVGEHSDLIFGGCICLLAEVGEAPLWQRSWRMVAIEGNALFVGNKLSDRVRSAAAMGRYGVGGTMEGRVFLWDFSTGTRVVEMFEQDSAIVQVGASSCSAALLTVAEDGRIVLYV